MRGTIHNQTIRMETERNSTYGPRPTEMWQMCRGDASLQIILS